MGKQKKPSGAFHLNTPDGLSKSISFFYFFNKAANGL